MKLAILLLSLTTSINAFSAPATFSRGVSSSVASTYNTQNARPASKLYADPDEEEEGLDLNLEEMFEMFDAADKEENFDDAVKKVKGE